MPKVTADTRPRCVAFVHPTMGSLDTCKKFAHWLVNGKPICIDCVAKHLINLGDNADTVVFDTVIVVK
jgi:hypothetical protein